ncbi:dTDP-4-dehydrorhamnose 3,5-epimerase [Sphingomonas sp.]|uniref:dTDP-4-dehydrorhamnose 3,5-epimerase n=1 Tax=Sphingomonas sp. TaxID=28214 RepID=UPI0035BBAE6D
MTFKETTIPGCTIVRQRIMADDRGRFAKLFQADAFAQAGLRIDWREEFHSRSRRDVVRGMHFQTPPADHAKLVVCLAGAVLDVVVDLRRGSPAFEQVSAIELSEANGIALYVPSGCAHGFVSLSDDSLMLYKVTSVHSPENDCGIAWDSLGFDWGVAHANLSERDRHHPRMVDFDTPFTFDPAAPAR